MCSRSMTKERGIMAKIVQTAGRNVLGEFAPEFAHFNIPADVKHWHGAAPDSWFSHLAVEVPGEGAELSV